MNRELVLACLTFVAGYLVGWLVSYHRVRRIELEKAMLVQVTGELCEKCGWAMKFPDEPCRCELDRELDRLRGGDHYIH